jgi:hypothetical protein
MTAPMIAGQILHFKGGVFALLRHRDISPLERNLSSQLKPFQFLRKFETQLICFVFR